MAGSVTVALAATFLLVILFSHSEAQYPFGKNKIQYFPKDWKLLETEHSEIFYYPDEYPLARFIAQRFESLYQEYSSFFQLEIEGKTPLILYGTHHDFKETNVLPYLIPEGTGGFTEFIKGRVAIPFTGSYGEMLHVFRHEMVHVFMLEKLARVMTGHRRYNYSHPPLWFTEGLAEYLSCGQPDSRAEMFIRDAVTSGNIVPLGELWRIQGSFMMYKEGESALHYLEDNFGKEGIRMILENWWKGDKFEIVLKKTIGMGVDELSRNWEESLRRRYYPSVMRRRRMDETNEKLSWGNRIYHFHPVSMVDRQERERVFTTGYQLGTINIIELVRDGRRKWKNKIFIRGGQSTEFESIPLLRSRLSSRGDTLVFSSKSGERDVIYLYDISRRKVIKTVSCPSARIINSPSLSPDGKSVVFSAITPRGKSDLFIYNFGNGTFSRLTDDYYDDIHPHWAPGENKIVFSSDRGGDVMKEKYAIHIIDLETLEIRKITAGESSDKYPRWTEDGKGILYSSDREGAYDIYLWKGGKTFRQTEGIGGALDPVPIPGSSSFVFSGYSGGTYRIYRREIREESGRLIANRADPEPDELWQPFRNDSISGYDNRNYTPRFSLDLIGAAFSVDPDFGYMGNGAQLFFSDLMGNHQIITLLGSATDTFEDFWRKLNVAVTYVNQQNRINYAVGSFHLASYMGTFQNLLRYERRYGAFGAVSYPISKFTRLEFSTELKWMERDDDITAIGMEQGSAWLSSNYISFTTDNIVWQVGGPLKGHRLNIFLGRNFDLDGSRYESTTLHLDLRNYISLTPRIIFAQRFLSRNAWGSDLQLFYLGGSWDLRGYDFREFAGKRIMLINNELRFPLLDRLVVGFPVGQIEFPLFRGSLFLDAGRASGFIMDTGWLGSIGTGVEMNLGYLPVIRVNFSRQTDFETIDTDTKVDFFLGFNF